MSDSENNTQYWGSRSISGRGSHTSPLTTDGESDAARSDVREAHASTRLEDQPFAGYHSGKDHVVAGLLAIFLGGLGIHKFYLGYHSVGFIMLGVTILGSIFTIGLAGLVMEVFGVVEGIIYLSKDQQSFDNTYIYHVKEWF